MLGRLSFGLCVLSAVAITASVGWAASCEGSGVTVASDRPELVERICRAAEDSTALLAECGLQVPGEIEIGIVGELPFGCLGLYHCNAARIDVLDPDAFVSAVAPEGPFFAVSTEALYDSIVVHEMAHAAYDDGNCPFATCPVAAEYIAYVMQVRSLPDSDRDAFEAATQIDTSSARSYLSATMLAMSPQRFAAAAWAHFLRQASPCGYIEAIAAGDVVLDRERP